MIRIPWRRQIVNNVVVLLEAACYTLSTEQSCYRVADLYSYIEWGGADGQKNVFFKDLMAFDMFALALLTFFFTFLK